MKKLLFFCLPLLFLMIAVSCNDREEGDQIKTTEAVKIDSVKVAQYSMDVFTTQTIKTYSNYSSNCEGFFGYDYLHTEPLERQVVSYKFNTTAACGEPVTRASQINFRPQEVGTYKFRFWNGTDSAGQDQWLEKIIEVH
ncbi:hypothetical protein [Kaistella palustris]|uniref:hypothetical protein n=1 Tax=Kaistella palustris TaxID=493376 RepID=UPI0003F820DE|nr:hypothetical protein [Kaistella palustris]